MLSAPAARTTDARRPTVISVIGDSSVPYSTPTQRPPSKMRRRTVAPVTTRRRGDATRGSRTDQYADAPPPPASTFTSHGPPPSPRPSDPTAAADE